MNRQTNRAQVLSRLILERRTRKPKNFKGAPSSDKIVDLINIARHAPNHHRSQPARFYLLNSTKIKKNCPLVCRSHLARSIINIIN